jgi:hypothetical protein
MKNVIKSYHIQKKEENKMIVTKTFLNTEALKAQLQEGEELRFGFKYNCTPIEGMGTERYHCKNGHFNAIPNSMGFDENFHSIIKCSECDEIIFEAKPYASRNRELQMVVIEHSCRTCKELTQTFHPDDDWNCRKGHTGRMINKTNDCSDYEIKS